jgi:hypothetical protein
MLEVDLVFPSSPSLGSGHLHKCKHFPLRSDLRACTYVSDDRGHLWRGSELEPIGLRVSQIGVDSDEYRHVRSASEYTPGYVSGGLQSGSDRDRLHSPSRWLRGRVVSVRLVVHPTFLLKMLAIF